MGVVAALSVIFAGTLAAAPMAGASGVAQTISNTSAFADSTSTTSLDVTTTIAGSSWATTTDPSVKLYAVDAASLSGSVPQNPPSTDNTCTATFMGQGSTWTSITNFGSLVMKCTITGLTPGHLYHVWAIGYSGATVLVTDHTITPGGVGALPDDPTNVTVTGGNGQATVSWTLGALGDGTFQDANANLISNTGTQANGTCTVNVYTPPTPGTTQSCTIYGLPAKSAGSYSVSLILFTSIGTKYVTAVTGPAINAPATPAAPTVAAAIPNISAMSSNMMVYVNASSDLGGSAIRSTTCVAHDVADGSSTTNDVTTIGYATQSYINTQSACTFSSTALTMQPYWNFTSNSSSTHTIPAAALTVGHTYTFTAKVTNATGDSAFSATSSFQQLYAGAAGAPTNVATASANGSAGGLTVTWTASTANGTPVTGYQVSASPEQKIQTNCTFSMGSNVMRSVHDSQDNEYIVTSNNGQNGQTYSLSFCSAAGVLKTIPLNDVTAMGGVAGATISGTTGSVYLADRLNTGQNAPGQVEKLTIDTSAGTLTPTRQTVFTTPSYFAVSGNLVSNADGTVF